MKPTPKGWNRINPSIFYDDAPKAIDWLCDAFGFEIRLKVEGANGDIEHSELVYGDGLVMVGSAKRREGYRSPKSVGGFTGALFLYVDDIDAHFARAKEKGAKITMEMHVSDYGEEFWSDRGYSCQDLEGHFWSFAQRLRSTEKESPKFVKHP